MTSWNERVPHNFGVLGTTSPDVTGTMQQRISPCAHHGIRLRFGRFSPSGLLANKIENNEAAGFATRTTDTPTKS
jgi:hypothetical protein